MAFHIHDYGKVYNNGVKYVMEVFNGPVTVQEKVDGSQISFGFIEGELCFRSHNQQIMCYAPNDMFAAGVKAIEEIKDMLIPNVIYRGEYLQKPKHNALKYERVPARHIILFDMEDATHPDNYFPSDIVAEEAERLGLECVPTYFVGKVDSVESLLPFLTEKKPILGGDFIEGIVIKNYNLSDGMGKFLKAKIVADDFREVHKQAWGEANPSRQDVVKELVGYLRTEARWNKAIAHLKENGELQEAPQDIGPLLKAVNQDILDEEIEYIKEILFKHFWKDISRGVTNGLPEWYKRKLVGVDMGIDL
jgi:hypothetical protein